MLPKCFLQPSQDSYSFTESIEPNIAVQLEGGASRLRADQLGVSKVVSVKWHCDPNQYNYMMAFYRTAVSDGSMPFLIDLAIDQSALQEYTARFVPQTFKLESKVGITYYLVASLEVLPIPVDTDNDNQIIASMQPDAGDS